MVHTIKDIGVSAMLPLQPFKSNGFTLENMHTLKYVFFRFDVFVSFVIGKKILNFLCYRRRFTECSGCVSLQWRSYGLGIL